MKIGVKNIQVAAHDGVSTVVISERISLFLMTNPVLSGSNGVVETTRNTIHFENPGGE